MKISVIFVVACFTQAKCIKICQNDKLDCAMENCDLIDVSRDSNYYCRDVKCKVLSSSDCPLGTVFEEGIQMCGCCPGCARYRDTGQSCTEDPPTVNTTCEPGSSCPILKHQCRTGLICSMLKKEIGECITERNHRNHAESCTAKRTLGLAGNLHWIPVCDLDGTFAPKQCKGNSDNGICFCVDTTGQRIFGTEWRKKAIYQTCECSRKMLTLRTEGHLSTTHCSYDGNYEPLQCDIEAGLCYCVDPIKGTITGSIVPEHRWKTLPCYSPNNNGDLADSYLTRCEQEWITNQKDRQVALLYGFNVVDAVNFTCDYDGSFSPVRLFGTQSYCVTAHGKIIGRRSQGPNPYTEQEKMNCQCLRDSRMFKKAGMSFTKQCNPISGNYEAISLSNITTKEYRCVDKDGFFFGTTAPKIHKCCLQGNCESEGKKTMQHCKNYLQCSSSVS